MMVFDLLARYATENTVKILVGNKSEKDSDRAVATDDARVSCTENAF